MAKKETAGDAFRKALVDMGKKNKREAERRAHAEHIKILAEIDAWLTAEAATLANKVDARKKRILDQGYAGYDDLSISLNRVLPGDQYPIKDLKGLERIARVCKRLDINFSWEVYSYSPNEESFDVWHKLILKIDLRAPYVETGLIKNRHKTKPEKFVA